MTPIVFIHGIRVSHTMWNPQLAALTGTVPHTAIDLPGHGSRHATPFTMPAAVETVTEAIDALGRPARLVGTSLGGYVAYAAAAAHPDQVAGVVAVGSTAVVTPARVRPYRLMASVFGRDGIQRAILRLVLGRQAAADLAAGGLFPQTVPAVLDALVRFDALAAVADYGGPIWFVNGGWDRFRVDEERFVAAATDSRLVVLPRAGHLIGLTRPAAVTAVIKEAAAVVDVPDRTP